MLGVRGHERLRHAATTRPRFAHLRESVERAGAAATARQQAWSLAILARAHLLRGERSQAARRAGRLAGAGRASSAGWRSCRGRRRCGPSSTCCAGDLDGAADAARAGLGAGLPARRPVLGGHGRARPRPAHAGRGDQAGADRWLGEARTRCNRVSDRYQWVRGYVLDAAVSDRARPRRPDARAGRWSTRWRRWPPAATCGSWSSARTCTAAGSATRPRSASARLLGRRHRQPGARPPCSTARPPAPEHHPDSWP